MFDSTSTKIAAVAFLVSVCFSQLVFTRISDPQRLNPDPDRFGELAISIAQGSGFVYRQAGESVLERTPLYPLTLAGLFTLAGGFSLAAVQLLHAAIHALTSLGVFHIARKLFDANSARTPQMLFAIHPIAVWYTARIWLETTHTFLLVAVGLALLVAFESPSLIKSLVAGVLIGVSCLIKPLLLLFPFVVAGLLLYRYKLGAMKHAMVVLIAACTVIAPWSLRNYSVSGRFIPVNTSLGFNLVQGEVIGESWFSARFGILDYWQKGKERADAILKPHNLTWESADGDRVLTNASLQAYTIGATGVRRVAANFCAFWYLSESLTKSIVFGVLQIPLALLALVSLKRLTNSINARAMPLVLLVAYYVFVNVLVVGWGRYSMPMIPFLLVFSTPMLERVSTRLRRQ